MTLQTKTPLEDWEQVGNSLNDPEKMESTANLPPYSLPNSPTLPATKLRILGATWGGVQVTQDVQEMVSRSNELFLDARGLCDELQPDPAHGVQKVLSVVYTYLSDEEIQSCVSGCPGIFVLNLAEDTRAPVLTIRDNGVTGAGVIKTSPLRNVSLEEPWTGSRGLVQILAVFYGPKRIEKPSVLRRLSLFFEGDDGGHRKQIRMTSSFFKGDTWVGHKKSWTVYFRFVGEKAGRVQVVTGLEDGALEVPWTMG